METPVVQRIRYTPFFFGGCRLHAVWPEWGGGGSSSFSEVPGFPEVGPWGSPRFSEVLRSPPDEQNHDLDFGES